jgi:uncharacterized membrane protein YdjX (TVP38/TMEM64 family)
MEQEKRMDKEKENITFSVKFRNYIKNLFDFSKYDKKTILFIILFAFLFIVSVGILFYNYFINSTFLYTIVIQYFVNPIFELGYLGILLFLLIMVLQAVLVPIPSEILIIAAGIIWGVLLGGIIGIAGSMVSAIIAYYIASKGGRPLAEKFVGETTLGTMDRLIQKYGTGFIIVARFLPFVAFDPVSYASGVLKVPPKKYMLGTLIGVIPRAFFYAWLGASLGIQPPVNINELNPEKFQQQADLFNTILLIILIVLALGFLFYYLTMKYLGKKKGNVNNSIDENTIDKKEIEKKNLKLDNNTTK